MGATIGEALVGVLKSRIVSGLENISKVRGHKVDLNFVDFTSDRAKNSHWDLTRF